MASIESLLNPAPELVQFSLPSPTPSCSASTAERRANHRKRQKLTKDGPIFTKGKIRGVLRYPPCEERDENLTKLHREFQIRPMGLIADYPRHIPYNSDKKSFQALTGRGSFEVFQYTFVIPGEGKEWTVMWDYNIGLVRTTHLFKCNDYSKTAPAKMLNANPGLRDICHSITGGALAAQGYWMPFEAAKAVAATFCWKIRHALTPLFGLDFPSLCVHPDSRGRYGRMVIEPRVVQEAAEAAKLYRMLDFRSTPVSVSGDQPRSNPGSQQQALHRRRYAAGTRARPMLTTPEYAGSYCTSPANSHYSSFTSVSTPRSSDVAVPLKSDIPLSLQQEIPRSISAIADSEAALDEKIRIASRGSGSESEPEDSSSASSFYSAGPSSSVESYSTSLGLDGDHRSFSTAVSLIQSSACKDARDETRPRHHRDTRSAIAMSETVRFAHDVKAARTLLSLCMHDALDSEDGNARVQVSRLMLGHRSGQVRKRRWASV